MAKQKQRTAKEPKALIPKRYHHLVAVGAILLSILLFFNEAIFSGKVFNASDNIASQSFRPFLQEAEKEGVYPLWVPYIFGGMPSFGSLIAFPPRLYDISESVVSVAQTIFTTVFQNRDVTSVLFYYFIFGISTYFFMIHKKKTPIVATFTAFATIFSTFVIILIMVGHNTKIPSLCLLPIVLLLIEKMIDDFRWWHGIVLTVAIHIQQLASHIQIIYYSYLLIGIYFLFLLTGRIIKKEALIPLLRSGTVFVLAAGISFAMSADVYLSTLEYNPYSIRGSNPIVPPTAAAQTKTAAGGLDYEYATNWSFSPGEVMTFVIPSFYGFGIQEYRGPIFNNQPTRLPTYWGPMAFTDAPQYMGIVVLLLALIGVYYHRRDPFIQAMSAVALLGLFLSFGREFSVVYDLFYYYVPYFNKFRVPSMALILPQILIPVFAGYGLQSILDKKTEKLPPKTEKRLWYSLGAIGILIGVGILGRSIFEDIYKGWMGSEGTAKLMSAFGRQTSEVLAQLQPVMIDFVFTTTMTDYFISLVLLLVSVGLFFAYRKGAIASTTVSLLVIGMTIFDLWRIDAKPMEMHDKKLTTTTFATPDYVKAIQNDTTLYRVLDTENLASPSNTLAYFKLQSIGGYHGAKLRIYQDMVDVATLGNPIVLELMNTKYIIANLQENLSGLPLLAQGRTKKVYGFPRGTERAWFVDSIAVDSGLGILNRIKNLSFDPKKTAFLESAPSFSIERPTTNTSAVVKSYGIHHLSLHVVASGNNLLFVSELYYPKGWIAKIDGQPTEIYKTNYAFRSIVVPKGSHTVDFTFEPSAYPLGRIISLAANILAWGAMLTVGFLTWKGKRKNVGANQTQS